jgi:L-asparaginase/Glu-tRNA(Gln) amidotransferase subunit D
MRRWPTAASRPTSGRRWWPRAKGVIIVRSSRVGQGIVARNGEANDDQLDFVVSDTLNAQKARILLMLALTRTSDTKEIQRMFYTY